MKILLFLGSVRASSPPRPARLGERVTKAVLRVCEGTYAHHQFRVVDPLDYELGGVFKPEFAYRKGRAPQPLQDLSAQIAEADGYVVVSPEYNHSMSPALAHLLNHFGSSLFSYKPSAIVTYSAGQWGGARAAVNLRTFLSELGCLPVSAMSHVPKAQEVFTPEGMAVDTAAQERWDGYFGRTLAQLMWWAEAAKTQRSGSDPADAIGIFRTDPSERNAP